MQRLRIFAAILGLAFAVGTAHADIVDPQIIIRSGTATGTIHITPGNLTTTVVFPTDPRCTFPAGPGVPNTINGVPVPTMDCGVVNQSGTTLNSLTFIVQYDPSLLTFQSIGFSGVFSLNFNQNTGFSTLTFVFDTPLIDGEDLHVDFLNFNTAGESIGFIAGVPEPATFGLLLLGLGGIALRRRKEQI